MLLGGTHGTVKTAIRGAEHIGVGSVRALLAAGVTLGRARLERAPARGAKVTEVTLQRIARDVRIGQRVARALRVVRHVARAGDVCALPAQGTREARLVVAQRRRERFPVRARLARGVVLDRTLLAGSVSRLAPSTTDVYVQFKFVFLARAVHFVGAHLKVK